MLGPIRAGQTRPSWVVEILKSDNDPLDISGATFAGALVNLRTSQVKALTTGNYGIDDASNGKFSYSPDADEVDESGLWEFRTELTISGETYMVALPIEIQSWRIVA